MTDPLLWLDGDPTDGRRARPHEPEPALGPPPLPDPTAAARRRRRGGHFGAALAGGLVAAVLVGGGAFAARRGRRPTAAAAAPRRPRARRRQADRRRRRDLRRGARVRRVDQDVRRLGHGLRGRRRRHDRHQRARGRQRERPCRSSSPTTRPRRRGSAASTARRTSRCVKVDTCTRDAEAAVAGGLLDGPHRPAGGRDRLAVRALADGHRRDRLRHRPPHPGARRLPDRLGDPDRRADQPRQLRRPAARRHGQRDRRQLADRVAVGRAAWASASRCRPTPSAT